MGAFAQFERELIKERQRQGIALAKAKGDVYRGRVLSLTADKATLLRGRAAAGEPKAELAREFDIRRDRFTARWPTARLTGAQFVFFVTFVSSESPTLRSLSLRHICPRVGSVAVWPGAMAAIPDGGGLKSSEGLILAVTKACN